MTKEKKKKKLVQDELTTPLFHFVLEKSAQTTTRDKSFLNFYLILKIVIVGVNEFVLYIKMFITPRTVFFFVI